MRSAVTGRWSPVGGGGRWNSRPRSRTTQSKGWHHSWRRGRPYRKCPSVIGVFTLPPFEGEGPIRMMFSIGTGSVGEGSPSYSVRLPFALSPGRTLKLADGDRFELLGHVCEISQEHNQYALTIRDFDSEDAASTFLLKACAGLIWFGLKSSVGFRFNPDITPTELFAQPKPIAEGSSIAPIASKKGWREYDGHYDADQTIVRPDHKRLIMFTAGSATVRIDTPISVLSKAMLEGMAEGRPELVLRDRKLRLACEVYLSSHFESTPAASFLSRITTLEILVTDAPASEPIQTMVKRFIDEVAAAKENEKDAALQHEFESLVSRLAYLRYRSIKSRIRSLVEEKLRTESDIAEPAKVSKEVSRLYDLRSTLVHTGKADTADIGEGNNRLNEIVPRVLRALFRETARRD